MEVKTRGMTKWENSPIEMKLFQPLSQTVYHNTFYILLTSSGIFTCRINTKRRMKIKQKYNINGSQPGETQYCIIKD